MPHIKVKPFNTQQLSKLDNIIFYGKEKSFEDELLLVNINNKIVAFDIIKKTNEYLIKPNKITKNAFIEDIKKFLNFLIDKFNLKVINRNTNLKKEIIKDKNKFLKNIEDFYDFKTSFKKIKIEIGFGSGRHLLYRAKKEQDTLFIGVEIHTPSINQVLKQIHLQGLNNIIIINYDARLLLEMMPSNILDKIYVHFPVPWDKKPHRRVISKKFLNEAIRTLKKESSLELRTDSHKYYFYALDIFNSFKNVKFEVYKNMDIEIISKYEERWRKMNKDIYTLIFYSLEESKNRVLNIDFSFDMQKNNIKFKKESIVKDDFFIHFSKEYKSLIDNSLIVECSFGNFNMPERKLIYISEDESRYYPNMPVKNLANFKAHQYIQEVINGKCN